MTKTATIQAQQRWDYCLETRKTESSLLNTINGLGQQGWELVNVLYYKDIKGVMSWTAFLKRPSVGQAPAATNQQTSNTMNPVKPESEKAALQGFDLSGDEFEIQKE